MISLPKLMGSRFAAGLVRLSGLSSELLLGLVVAVGDQSVQEAVRAASVVAFGLCALDLTVEVAGGLLVDVVLVGVLAEISVLVVHGKLALQLLSDVGHVCSRCVYVAVGFTEVVVLSTGCDVFLI